MPIRSLCAFAAVVLSALPRFLPAQQRPSADSARADTLRPYPLAPVVITATAIPAPASRVGFPTSVVDSAILAREPTPLITRVLTFLPGASIEEGAGPGQPAVLHVRGGDEPFTQMLFDGVAVNISGGYNDVNGLLLTNVGRVELTRGPLSAVWGSGALAGAVQFVTREGQVGAPRFRLLAEGGSATQHGEQTHTELDASGGSARLRYSTGVGFAYNRGTLALPTDMQSGDASIRLDATVSSRLALTATARYVDLQSQLPMRDAGDTVPLDPHQRDARHRWTGSLDADWAATPSWHHRLSAQLFWDNFVYHEAFDSTLDPVRYPTIPNYTIRAQILLLRPGVEYLGSNVLGLGKRGSQLTVSYGAQWQREHEVDDNSGDFTQHDQLNRSNEALFTELQGALGQRLSLIAGARLEKYQGLASQLLPRASIVVGIVPGWLSLRAAAGRAFLVPNISAQYLSVPGYQANPDLRPMKSITWEIGGTLTPPGGTSLKLGYFHRRDDDFIRTVPADTGTNATSANLGAALSEGVETELDHVWPRHWRTGVNLTWVKTKILDNAGLDVADYPNGASLPAIPTLTGNAFVFGDVSRVISTFARVTLVGKQDVLANRFTGPRVPIDAYALAEVSLQWHVRSSVEAYTRVSNLFNTTYETAFNKPGLPRTVVLGLRTGF